MSDRWVLNRAGILNVYQYGDEVLHFADGRLLLRGVNGSGKSTAMNMLLPFLLDADTRRIDAAGEQTGVLRAWMLNGRDEQQPVGYLWVEFEHGDRHLVCGCGIRANRSTETVNTWWFVTSRRPEIDVALVEGRIPLSVDGLKAVLEPGAVYTKDQRQAYRAEVRARLFGGSDLDQHISLLHVVRSPRVGDRIDTDLPGYLNDALPQLSEAAIDDAAQPLEDLEEHRRNVAALATTAGALDALARVYGLYARTELRRRAADALDHVAEVKGCRRAERAARHRLDDAHTALAAARATADGLDADERRLVSEIAAMRDLPAYRAGQTLEDLRGRVRSLLQSLEAAKDRVVLTEARRDQSIESNDQARSTFDTDLGDLTRLLSDLHAACASGGVSVPLPDAPTIGSVDADGVVGPAGLLEPDAIDRALAEVVTALAVRRAAIADVRDALDRVTAAEAALRAAERDCEHSRAAATDADATLRAQVEQLHATVESFRALLRHWVERVTRALADVGAGAVLDLADVEAADLLDRRDDVHRGLSDALASVLDSQRAVAAALDARRDRQVGEVDVLDSEFAELMARSEPDPPLAPWQTATPAVRLAQVIDFAPGLDGAVRSGLEAAMEGAGLLGAELGTDGLRLEDGQLIVATNEPVASPLSQLLTVSIPERLAAHIRRDDVMTVLHSISTDLHGPASTVAAIDGTFRTGALSGRHAKRVAEHIGASARAAALERRRTEVRDLLDRARRVLDATDDEIATQRDRIGVGVALLAELPGTSAVDRAVLGVESAESTLAQWQQTLDANLVEVEAAERTYGDSVDASARIAATLALPHTHAGLAEVEADLNGATDLCGGVRSQVRLASRSCRGWSDTADRCHVTTADLATALTTRQRLADEHEPLAMRLATLEDTLGAAHAEVLAAIDLSTKELDAARAALPAARDVVEECRTARAGSEADMSTAVAKTEEADQRCVAQLGRLRAALAVPGLRAATPEPAAGVEAAVERAHEPPVEPAVEPADEAAAAPGDEPAAPAADLPAVAESTEGVGQLAEFVLTTVAAPDTPTSAESVRQSLRQRRDTLGAGWDAEDRQPDETLPLQIEVTGPMGRLPLADATAGVRRQLRHQSGLLTAKQDQALRNLLQGLIAKEVAEKLFAARALVQLMNRRLGTVSTSHGIAASLRWRRRDDLDDELTGMIDLMSKPPGLRDGDEEDALSTALSARIEDARRTEPDASYRQLISEVLDYRRWHEMTVLLHRPGSNPERLTRRTALSEGEKKMVSYLPLFAAVAASADALAEREPAVPRFVLLDDAFAKVSEDNHAALFGLLVELDLDFIATSERLWGTHASVPALAITEVIRDAESGVIVLEHARWDGHVITPGAVSGGPR